MQSYRVKAASAFPARPRRSYKELFIALRAGKCIEVPVASRADAVKVRRSVIASLRRWLTDSETLHTAISDTKVSLLLTEKPQ
jgi:hypothetical protein